MFESTKIKKQSQKFKGKLKKETIEEGIPEAPRLCDFDLGDLNLGESHENHATVCDVTSQVADLSVGENELNECHGDLNVTEESSSPVTTDNKETHVKVEESSEWNKSSTADSSHAHELASINCDVITSTVSQSQEDIGYKNYSNLIKTVRSCAEELVTASAPTDDQFAASVVNPLNNVQSSSDSKETANIAEYSYTQAINSFLTPYSDEKLSEFYHNPELSESKNYINEFINKESNSTLKQSHYLYKLLVEYIQSKNNLRKHEDKIKELHTRLDICISTIWTVLDDIKLSETETCSDGNSVTFVQKYSQAQFNSNVYDEFIYLLKQIKVVAFQDFQSDSFISQFLKLKIEYYLQRVRTSCSEFTNLQSGSPVIISQSIPHTYLEKCISDLREAISILFIFQRRHNFDIDHTFMQESRQWLSDLISVLIRVGSWRDHIFILSHVIRCSGGVGDWAARFIQLPASVAPLDPFRNGQINHIMTVMSIFLSPVRPEEKLNGRADLDSSNPWTVVDSDGEIEEDTTQMLYHLKENDMVAILNQIPFQYLFKEIFYRSQPVTYDYLLKLFSFSTDFIRILLSGLKLYSHKRYKQFTKRLGRLICHIVHYTTETVILYVSQNVGRDESARIQAEYDEFFLRSAKSIFSAKKHGTWQFLAAIPYATASPEAILKLYSSLQLTEQPDDHVLTVNFAVFEEKFTRLPEEEQCYLLTTLANMASARNAAETDFVENVLLQLFFVGFVGSSTTETSHKTVENLLGCICTTHPSLTSKILKIQNRVFLADPGHDDRLCLHLWLTMPLHLWTPAPEDLEILSGWVREPWPSVRHELARIVLQSLNYGLSGGELFMSSHAHRTIAFALMEASTRSSQESDQGFIRNVSNLVLSQNGDPNSHEWMWSVLLKLRLHLFDKPEASLYKCLSNLSESLATVPDVERCGDLLQFVVKKHPVACYVALMTTNLGHFVPVICERGFDLVEVLISDGKYVHGIACLEFITYAFLECVNSLVECEKFVSILSQLIVADNTYVQMAKKLIVNADPGPVLTALDRMIQSQLNGCRAIHSGKFGDCVRLWLLSLTRIPLWYQNSAVVHLIDTVLRNAFFDFAASAAARDILANLSDDGRTAASVETRATLSSLVGWMNSRYSPPTLLPRGFDGDAPWLSYLLIQIEFDMYEKSNRLWPELLKELSAASDRKTDVDNSLKRVSNALGLPVRTSGSLAIYKWTNQILNTDVSHPLVPLLWQNFFSLYFYRVAGLLNCGSLGQKFFDGVINQRLFKQLKQRLTETWDKYKDLVKNEEVDTASANLVRLFQTYSFWLEDGDLHRPHLNVYTLPPDYNHDLLTLLIHGSDAPWIDYLDYAAVEKGLRSSGSEWSGMKNRSRMDKSPSMSQVSKWEKSLSDKMSEMIGSYECPSPPPPVNGHSDKFNKMFPSNVLCGSQDMMKYLRPLFGTLLDCKDRYNGQVSENLALGEALQELSPHLYGKTRTEKVLKDRCEGVSKVTNGRTVHHACSGPAVVTLNYEEWKLNERVQRKFDECRKAFVETVRRSMTGSSDDLNSSAVAVDVAIEELQKEFRSASDGPTVERLRETGVNTFYEVVRTWQENGDMTPPLSQAFDRYVDVLGGAFIRGNPNETEKLLQLLLNGELRSGQLLTLFQPNASSPDDFAVYYMSVLTSSSPKRFDVLAKFDLASFLTENKPRFPFRSRLISLVGKGLATTGKDSNDSGSITLLNDHLQILLKYDFPEHYGEVLNLLLEASQSQSLNKSTWYAFLNCLMADECFAADFRFAGTSQPEISYHVKRLKHHFVKYGWDQRIQLNVIQGTISVLASNFHNERSKSDFHGLYKKYNDYIEPLFIFFGMLSYSCVAKTVELDRGSLSEKLTQQLWPRLCDLYSPWLVPYESAGQGHGGQTPSSPAPALPWTCQDLSAAALCSATFTESIRFVLETLPGHNNLLRYVWVYYVNHFAHPHVGDHVLNVVHESLLSLPWENFLPNVHDVELMLRVVNQFLPLSHNFLGNIFVNIKWPDFVRYCTELNDGETATKLHVCLLHLLVKLPFEPSLKQNAKVPSLLDEANRFPWHLIDSRNYEIVLNWFIMSCDPRIILMDERLEYYKLDSTIFKLLQTCAGYVTTCTAFHPTTLTKRMMFVRACVKWLVSSNRRFKSKESQLFREALRTMWTVMDSVINETTAENLRVDEATVLLGEFFAICSETELCGLVREELSKWLTETRSRVIAVGVLRSAGTSLESSDAYANIVESTLDVYFSHISKSDWSEVTRCLVPFAKANAQLEKTLIENQCFITLYAILLKKINRNKEQNFAKSILTDLFQLLTDIKLSSTLEPKVILLIAFCLRLIEAEVNVSEKDGISLLIRFSNILNKFLDDKNAGFLSAIGLKRPASSNRFKLISLVTCAGITVFLQKNHPDFYETFKQTYLDTLKSVDGNKLYQDIEQYAFYAKTVVDEISSLTGIVEFVQNLGFKLFCEFYLESRSNED